MQQRDLGLAFLSHYGVLGMRWGVRKSRGSGRVSSHPYSKGSKDHIKAQHLKKKGLKNLTNEELKTVNQRIQLESQYKKLNPGHISKGKNVLKELAGTGALVVGVYSLSKSPLVKDVGKIIMKKRGL